MIELSGGWGQLGVGDQWITCFSVHSHRCHIRRMQTTQLAKRQSMLSCEYIDDSKKDRSLEKPNAQKWKNICLAALVVFAFSSQIDRNGPVISALFHLIYNGFFLNSHIGS